MKAGVDEVHFKIENVSKSLVAGVEFKLSIDNVKNSPSLRPSGEFTGILFFDYILQQDLTEFNGNLSITTSILGNIDSKTANITQSSYTAELDS